MITVTRAREMVFAPNSLKATGLVARFIIPNFEFLRVGSPEKNCFAAVSHIDFS